VPGSWTVAEQGPEVVSGSTPRIENVEWALWRHLGPREADDRIRYGAVVTPREKSLTLFQNGHGVTEDTTRRLSH
jgi:hypothetical protein